LARPVYRARQVFTALFPRVDAADLGAVAAVLPPPLLRLFETMERRDQRHAIEVMRRLEAGGVTNPDLLTAALLHDCGKGAVPVWLRVAYVLSPTWVDGAAREGAAGWRGAAYRLSRHVELGLAAAESAGASAATLRLISGTVDSSEQENLRLLHAADDAS
jgi:hypothetical protein